MRTRTIHTIAIAMTLAALTMLGAPPAAAQTPDDVIGLHDPMAAGGLGANLNGIAADHDKPIHDKPVQDDWPRLTARSAAGATDEYNASISQTFTFSQTLDSVVGFQYNLMLAGNIGTNLDGVAVDYDRPLWGEHIRFAAAGAFAAASGHGMTLSQTFAGAGPGVRHDTSSFDVWAHALFGYRRDALTYVGGNSGFDGRFAAGIDYPLGSAWSLRAGVAYGGNVHVTAGMSFRL